MIMFQRITVIFPTVTLMAVCPPFLKAIFKALSQVSILEISYPMAAFRSAILSRLLPCGILFESTLPPLILLLGASLSREEKCCACRELVPNLLGPISLINVSIVEWLTPGIGSKYTPSKY